MSLLGAGEGADSPRPSLREAGANPARARRCNRGRPPSRSTGPKGPGRFGGRMIREPEDRPSSSSVLLRKREGEAMAAVIPGTVSRAAKPEPTSVSISPHPEGAAIRSSARSSRSSAFHDGGAARARSAPGCVRPWERENHTDVLRNIGCLRPDVAPRRSPLAPAPSRTRSSSRRIPRSPRGPTASRASRPRPPATASPRTRSARRTARSPRSAISPPRRSRRTPIPARSRSPSARRSRTAPVPISPSSRTRSRRPASGSPSSATSRCPRTA